MTFRRQVNSKLHANKMPSGLIAWVIGGGSFSILSLIALPFQLRTMYDTLLLGYSLINGDVVRVYVAVILVH